MFPGNLDHLVIRRDQLGHTRNFAEGIMGNGVSHQGHGNPEDAVANQLGSVYAKLRGEHPVIGTGGFLPR